MSVQMRTILDVADNSGARKLQVILPLGGAFVLLKGIEEIVELGGHLTGLLPHHHKIPLVNRWSFAATALALFGLLHGPAFRATAFKVLSAIALRTRGRSPPGSTSSMTGRCRSAGCSSATSGTG